MKNKGMSQTLALIVAATVLLMAALAVIFLTSNTIGDFGESSQGQGCVQTVQAQCAIQGSAGKVNLPGSCETEDQLIQKAKDQDWTITEDKVRCNSVD